MRTVVFLAVTLVAGGCASITRGTTEQLQINSSPPEAQARTSLGYVCVTPCTLQTNRKDEFTVLISKPGFHSAEVPVKTQVSVAGGAGFAGNVLVGGLVGMGTDAVTGAAMDHFPNPVSVTLVPLKKGETPSVIHIEPKPPEQKPGQSESKT